MTVEGFFDVMKLWQIGVRKSVALMGSSLSTRISSRKNSRQRKRNCSDSIDHEQSTDSNAEVFARAIDRHTECIEFRAGRRNSVRDRAPSSRGIGGVCPGDRAANEAALIEGLRLFSVYRTPDGVKFWIITGWDRSLTMALLPEDY